LASRVLVALAGFILASFAFFKAVPNYVVADQRLQNGGFEQGLAGWIVSEGVSASGCHPRTGSGALNLSSSPALQYLVAEQTMAGAVGSGTHTLTGFVSVPSGSPAITIFLRWRDAAGREVQPQHLNSIQIAATANYALFTLATTNPPSAASLVVRLGVQSSSPSTVCFDDLGLEAPPPPPPTPTPTLTPTATLTPQPTSSFTPTIPPPTSATSTATTSTAATRTPTPAASQTAGASSTATPVAWAATVIAAGGLQFVNGGFEEGLRGWQRFGGELQVVGSPKRSGGGAAGLTSSTGSTKWVYQEVAIDPAHAYEFSGYLRPSAGVKSSYLRISWYESVDGSGRALSTDDSVIKLAGSSETFIYVSTGGIAPPAAAHSARLRVMLTPEGAGGTSLYMDDLAFFPPTVTPRPASNANDPDDPVETPVATQTPGPIPSASATSQTGASPAPGDLTATKTVAPARSVARATSTPKRPAVAEVAALRDATPIEATAPSDELSRAREQRHRSKFVWLAAAIAAVISFSGAYLGSKRLR